MLKKYFIYLISGLVLIAGIVYVIYLLTPLKITQISPQDGSKNIGIDQTFTLSFNKKVNANNFSVDINPQIQTSLKVIGKNLDISFSGNLEPNQFYTITLKSNYQFKDTRGQKVIQITWNFTTSSGTLEEIYDTNFDDLYAQYPLARYSPYDSDHFTLEGPDENGTFTITLKAIFNAGVNGPPIEEQQATYNQQLKDYKQESLDWIKVKGIDLSTLKIKWLPAEASNL